MSFGESVTPKIVKAIFNLRAERKTWTDIGRMIEQKEDWARWIAKRYSIDDGLPLKNRGQSRADVGGNSAAIWMRPLIFLPAHCDAAPARTFPLS